MRLSDVKIAPIVFLILSALSSSILNWYHTTSLGDILGLNIVWGIVVTIVFIISFIIVLATGKILTVKWVTTLTGIISFIVIGFYILNVAVFTKNVQLYIAENFGEYVHLNYGVYVCLIFSFITFIVGLTIPNEKSVNRLNQEVSANVPNNSFEINNREIYTQLTQLSQLHEKGIIPEEIFNTQKNLLLKKLQNKSKTDFDDNEVKESPHYHPQSGISAGWIIIPLFLLVAGLLAFYNTEHSNKNNQ